MMQTQTQPLVYADIVCGRTATVMYSVVQVCTSMEGR
jgi:hypothetical protein